MTNFSFKWIKNVNHGSGYFRPFKNIVLEPEEIEMSETNIHCESMEMLRSLPAGDQDAESRYLSMSFFMCPMIDHFQDPLLVQNPPADCY